MNTPTKTTSKFDSAAFIAYNLAVSNPQQQLLPQRQPFNLSSWQQKTTGGLMDSDRIVVRDGACCMVHSGFQWKLETS